MVLVHDTSSRRGLQVYQVSLKNNDFQVIERTRFVTDRQTDRQTDGRTDARGKTICLPTLSGGDIMTIERSDQTLQMSKINILREHGQHLTRLRIIYWLC